MVVARSFKGRPDGGHLKLRNKCLAFAALIASMVYVFAFTGGNFQRLVIAQVLFILWVALNIVFKLGKIKFSTYDITALWFLGLVLIGNLLLNQENYSVTNVSFTFAAAHIVGIFAFSFAAQWASRNLQPYLIFEFLAWMLAPLAVLAIVMGWANRSYIHLTPFGIHHNWWGEMAFGFVICALAVRLIKARIAFLVCGLLLMYAMQSRGASFSAAVSILTYWLLGFRPFGKTAMRRLVLTLIALGSIVFFMVAMGWWPYIVAFVEQRILLLNDPYRGLGTGLTHRLSLWKEAVAIFWENPIFGHGFDTFDSVHNGFLRFAAEGGVMLLGIISAMIISALVYAWRQRIDLVFASLLGMVTYFMTYPRALNLNIVGVLFLLTLFRWRLLPKSEDPELASHKGRNVHQGIIE